MGSRIEAVIYDGADRPAGLSPNLRVVSLGGGFGLTMLPVTDAAAEALVETEVGDNRISPDWPLLRQPVTALARQMSAGRRALYIVGETFAGEGIQEAIGWSDGKLMYAPSGTCDLEEDLEPGYHLVPRWDGAINTGLRVLGVHAVPDTDEYETVGLTRRRHTEDWLAER